MSIFNWFTNIFGTVNESSSMSDHAMSDDDFMVNPANGLPMVGGMGGMDIEGNPFGIDFSHDHIATSSIDDDFLTGSMFDDS